MAERMTVECRGPKSKATDAPSPPHATFDLRYFVHPDGIVRPNALYGVETNGFRGGPHLVDFNRQVTLPEPDDVPEDGFVLHAAYSRWVMTCETRMALP